MWDLTVAWEGGTSRQRSCFEYPTTKANNHLQGKLVEKTNRWTIGDNGVKTWNHWQNFERYQCWVWEECTLPKVGEEYFFYISSSKRSPQVRWNISRTVHRIRLMRKWRRNEEGEKKWAINCWRVAKARLDSEFQDLYQLHRLLCRCGEAPDPQNNASPGIFVIFPARCQRFSQIWKPVWWVPMVCLRSTASILTKQKSSGKTVEGRQQILPWDGKVFDL